MLKIAESYQFNKRNGKWYFHDMNFILHQIQWNGSNLCFNTRDRWKWCIYDIYDMKHKEVNYYTNNYKAFLCVEIKLWQKLQIILSFGLTILRVTSLTRFFSLAHCAWFVFSTLSCAGIFLGNCLPPLPLKNKMVHP